MPSVYSDRPHVRKHGPAGYTTYSTFKPWLRDEFCFRCVYCLERERWYPSGHAGFGVEHVKPKGRPDFQPLTCDYENLVYACNRCNSLKRDELLLDPCGTAFATHLRINEDGTFEGLTPEGRDLIQFLGLDQLGIRPRKDRLVLELYRQQPNDPAVRALYLEYFGYPDDMPNLDSLRPESNSRPAGLTEAYFRQRAEGRLPETYF